jgi:hypothetical protein
MVKTRGQRPHEPKIIQSTGSSRLGQIRKSRWNCEQSVIRIRAAIVAHRRDGMFYITIREKFGIPERTIRRYIVESRDPSSGFYLPQTDRERRMDEVKKTSLLIVEEKKSIAARRRQVEIVKYINSDLDLAIAADDYIGDQIFEFDPTSFI